MRLTPVRTSFACLLLCLCSTLSAAEFDQAKLAQIKARMQGFVDNQTVAGVVTVVGDARGAVQIDAVGVRDLETRAAMSPDTLFRIASMTKPITALAVMQQVEAGRLRIDDPVEKHLPEFRGQWQVASRDGGSLTLKRPSRPITVRDLLTHTSGLPSMPPAGLAELYQQRQKTLAEGVLVYSQQPLEFEPGSKWSYCNTGIDTLGRIVEVTSGERFEEYLAAHIFRPLKMSDTGFYPDEAHASRRASVYDTRDGKLVAAKTLVVGPPLNAKYPVPAGGLWSTATDLSRLYAAFLSGGMLDGEKIIDEGLLREMTRTQTGDLATGFTPGMSFGYGFAVVKSPEGVTEMLSPQTYGHGGAFGTQAWIDPRRGVFVVLLIQRVGLPNADASDIRREFQSAAMSAVIQR